jgi:hypothetical protein
MVRFGGGELIEAARFGGGETELAQLAFGGGELERAFGGAESDSSLSL